MNSKELTLLAAKAAAEKKGKDIAILQLGESSLITDYFIIISANSRVQAQAIAEYIEEEMEKAGFRAARREGYRDGRWILLDFGMVIIHIFLEEERDYYNLERLWGDAPRVAFQE